MGKSNIAKFISNEAGFSYYHSKMSYINDYSDPYHSHRDLLELFMPLRGKLDYVVEGEKFHIKPYELISISNNTLHKSILKSKVQCEFILLSINLDFFAKNECIGFVDTLLNNRTDTNIVINAETMVNEGILDMLMRIEKYINTTPVCLTVIKSVITELVYSISMQFREPGEKNHSKMNAKNYIEYIHDNITSPITVKSIANHFYISEQYLCRIFKQYTGMTIKKYVQQKRIILVKEFYSSGMSITNACIKAGFSDYSCFYRTFLNIMHEPPRKNLSNIRLQFGSSNSENNSVFIKPTDAANESDLNDSDIFID